MGATKIKHVSITNLWGIKNISTDFDERVNIFIGANGSSKTTFLNLIEAVLLCDTKTFADIEFKEIFIVFSSSTIEWLKVTQKSHVDISVKYTFSDNSCYKIPCEETLSRTYRSLFPSNDDDLYVLKKKLGELIPLSWLSINRDNLTSSEFERGRERIERFRNMVDFKLKDLTNKLIVYQLQLESEANKSANKFKEDVLSLMLYNESFDNFNAEKIKQVEDTDTTSMKDDLYKAFRTLGVDKNRNKNEPIEIHIKKIKEAIANVSSTQKATLEDVYVLALINRTLSIIDISKKHEQQTKDIFAPIENFWKCLQTFMPNKKFALNKHGKGDIEIELKEDTIQSANIPISSLSSGEKQLFILLSEALLQQTSSHLFIADEPELSLHIEWQQMILQTLSELNPNAQIIVATHSPEIAGSFPLKVINMKNITTYECR